MEIFSTLTNLVEIDLLRAWEPLPFTGAAPKSHYRLLIRRGEAGYFAELYPFNLSDPIPAIPLPLQANDNEPVINLTPLLNEIYIEGNYQLRINYQQMPQPPLTEKELAWTRSLLAP